MWDPVLKIQAFRRDELAPRHRQSGEAERLFFVFSWHLLIITKMLNNANLILRGISTFRYNQFVTIFLFSKVLIMFHFLIPSFTQPFMSTSNQPQILNTLFFGSMSFKTSANLAETNSSHQCNWIPLRHFWLAMKTAKQNNERIRVEEKSQNVTLYFISLCLKVLKVVNLYLPS